MEALLSVKVMLVEVSWRTLRSEIEFTLTVNSNGSTVMSAWAVKTEVHGTLCSLDVKEPPVLIADKMVDHSLQLMRLQLSQRSPSLASRTMASTSLTSLSISKTPKVTISPTKTHGPLTSIKCTSQVPQITQIRLIQSQQKENMQSYSQASIIQTNPYKFQGNLMAMSKFSSVLAWLRFKLLTETISSKSLMALMLELLEFCSKQARTGLKHF